jgi:hypothetical protein
MAGVKVRTGSLLGGGGLSFQVTGVDDFAALARKFKQAAASSGTSSLKQNLQHEADRLAPDLIQLVIDQVPEYLPSGYAPAVQATLRIRARPRRPIGMRLYGRAKTKRGGVERELRRLDQGVLRHPLWGNRRHWYPQSVRPGFWTKTLTDATAQVRARQAMVRGIDKTLDRILKGL